MQKAEDAMISKYSEKDGYTIIPEEEGTVVEEEKFFEVLENAVLNLKDSISMVDEDCYVKPEYTKDSEEIVKLAETMNKYVSTVVTYDFGDSQEVLNGKTIWQWVSVNEKKHTAKLSQEKIEEYVANLADTYNTAGKSKSLKSSYGTNVTVSGGDYGWKIDQEKEAEALKEHIKKGETVSKEPEYSQTAGSRAGNDYGDTYVEVNLTAQHLYYYKNGSLILETDFVSGNDARAGALPLALMACIINRQIRHCVGKAMRRQCPFGCPLMVESDSTMLTGVGILVEIIIKGMVLMAVSICLITRQRPCMIILRQAVQY